MLPKKNARSALAEAEGLIAFEPSRHDNPAVKIVWPPPRCAAHRDEPAYVVMAYVVMAYVEMAYCSYGLL